MASSIIVNNTTLPTQIVHTQNPLFHNGSQNGNDAIHIKEMENEISLWIIRLIVYFMFLVIVYSNFKYNIPLFVMYLPLILLDLFLMWYYIKKYKALKEINSSNIADEAYYYILEAIQNGIMIIFKICIYLRMSLFSINYSWSCFLLLSALIIRIILINSFSEEVSTPSSLIKTILRIFGLGLICSIFFKIDMLTEISWTSSFWYILIYPIRSYWILFTIMALISLAFCLVTLNSIYSISTKVISLNECIYSYM